MHAFVVLHELLEDARVESLYVAKYPESAAGFAALAEKEIADYDGENPVGAYKYALTRPYLPGALQDTLRESYVEFMDDDAAELTRSSTSTSP